MEIYDANTLEPVPDWEVEDWGLAALHTGPTPPVGPSQFDTKEEEAMD